VPARKLVKGVECMGFIGPLRGVGEKLQKADAVDKKDCGGIKKRIKRCVAKLKTVKAGNRGWGRELGKKRKRSSGNFDVEKERGGKRVQRRASCGTETGSKKNVEESDRGREETRENENMK